ncbi:hypothetical protein KP509_25G039600 [Ceratopteris richardii]|uniref:TRUD domain-containing protein n=1 Tax=Ceratopteris richardii TaxID=49495 RepID=A0A8T2RPM2_CERRI|nr:hypothetical protein KP509_25G039600 [Ceratopteris richardii]
MEEEQVGITCYANSARGFSGIVKQRYSDFIVNEIDSEGNVVHLTSLNLSEEVLESQNEETHDNEDIDFSNLEKHLGAFRLLAGDADVDLLRGLLTNYIKGDTKDSKPIVLSADSDKLHRTEIHNFFKNRFSFLVTDTVDGPDSSSKCVRVRFWDRRCDGGLKRKRLRGPSGNKNKSKHQKHDGDVEQFDSRGASDDWPSQRGKFLQFHLYKENKDTHDTLMVLGKMLAVQPKSFGLAGTKDKRAVTTQRVTVFKQKASRLSALNRKLYGIKVGDFRYVDNALGLGQLSGNQFTITLRGIAAESDDIINDAAAMLKKSGFINYFGLQRFGTQSVSTFAIGAALLRGEWESAVNMILQPRNDEREDILEARKYFQKTRDADGTLLRMPRHLVTERAVLAGLKKSPGNYLQAINVIPRSMRMLYIHSYQSYLWNHAASKRITLYGLNEVVEGDLVFCKDNADIALCANEEHASQERVCSEMEVDEDQNDVEVGFDVSSKNVRYVTADDVALKKFNIRDVVLPLPGSKTLLPANAIANTYVELARKDSLDLEQSSHNVKEFSFTYLSGSYRHLVQDPKELDWKILKYGDDNEDLAETDWDKIKKIQNDDKKMEQKDSADASSSEVKEGNDRNQCTALQLKFMLSSSCYATMVLRELMKIPSSVWHLSLSHSLTLSLSLSLSLSSPPHFSS